MPINVCSTSGPSGNIKISPINISTNGNEPITYTISVETTLNSLDLRGQLKIQTADGSVKTGQFLYQFINQNDIANYTINQNEDGFTFIFRNKNNRISFNLFPENFSSPYEAALIVDAEISGFGSETASLRIEPELQLVQADNFSDYAEEFGLQQMETGTDSDALDAPAEDNIQSKLDVINEYNFYQKDFEETSLNENDLLNINKNYSTFDIINYFKTNPTKIMQEKTILHTQDYMKEEYPDFDKQKNLFPMYMEIKFETDNSRAGLVSYLRKIGILEYFCFIYVNFFGSEVGTNQEQQLQSYINFISNSIGLSDSDISSKFNGKISSVKSFLNRSLQKILLLKILEKQADRVRRPAARGTTPVLFTEQILMYKVQKIKNEQVLSTQYLINNLENTEMIVFDTQLKYDVEYEYIVSKIEIINNKIVDSPIRGYNIKTKIIDSPPLPPDVNFLPFKGVDNQIMINLNTSVGRYADYPIIIKDSDYPVFNKILEYKKYSRILLNENKVQFEADEGNFIFEMYRLETAPDSYADFKNGIEITTNFTTILDNIKPNQKYYYIFRARDIHGNLSNPTKPIEIEMINENGTIYMLKKEYIFEEKEKMASKIFKNILELKPSREQMQINEELTYQNVASAKRINMVLGNKEVSLWNKPFLMRITSKKTGKKIDIKFKFAISQPK